MWLILGGILLYFGLANSIWGKIVPEGNKLIHLGIRGALTLAGGFMIASSFPAVFTGFAYPGWGVIGLLFLAICQTNYFWGQFKALAEQDKSYRETEFWLRSIFSLVGVICLGIGVGTGIPGGWDHPDPSKQPAKEIVRQQTK